MSAVSNKTPGVPVVSAKNSGDTNHLVYPYQKTPSLYEAFVSGWNEFLTPWYPNPCDQQCAGKHKMVQIKTSNNLKFHDFTLYTAINRVDGNGIWFTAALLNANPQLPPSVSVLNGVYSRDFFNTIVTCISQPLTDKGILSPLIAIILDYENPVERLVPLIRRTIRSTSAQLRQANYWNKTGKDLVNYEKALRLPFRIHPDPQGVDNQRDPGLYYSSAISLNTNLLFHAAQAAPSVEIEEDPVLNRPDQPAQSKPNPCTIL